MAVELISFAAYLPSGRLAPTDVGGRAGGRDRVVASFDEDSTTMAVEAAARALRRIDTAADPATVLLATTSPAYADKTNAVAVHAALDLPRSAFCADLVGGGRSSVAALRLVSRDGGIAVMSDVRVGRPGSEDEKLGGDGAAAFVFADTAETGDGVAAVIGTASVSAEFLDRWRDPRSEVGEQWEERFGVEQYTPLVREAAAAALACAGIESADHVVIACPNSGIAKRAATLVTGVVSTTTSTVGHSGAADLGVALAAALDGAGRDQSILVVSAVDGCDALVLRTLPGIERLGTQPTVAEQRSSGTAVRYLDYLSWRGLLDKQPPRRPEPDRPAGPPSRRSVAWKFSLTGSRCTVCDFLHLPPARVCRGCGTTDAMRPESARSTSGTVVTSTIDRLAYSPAPPVVEVVVDFDGGGRTTLEVADAAPDGVGVGARVTPTFRRLFTAGGVHNYFWKARTA
ncbi:OB-fold domain-containing protein [uncultured Williamsia sp.]|uniref:OB-fold domain-containing protein n=1 Tax=uncultured Williamsia sp. TaxID=259311 RepID=UPI00261DFFEA|nr:OB-fold domain-containing protein [uncultured Williamsia sp.]